MAGLFADVSAAVHFTSLGLSPIALDLGFFQLRWYSLAYIAGILAGWWYLLKLLQAPGAPMARRHADDLVTWVTLGIILGGRLAYVLFYDPARFLANPADIVKLWEGGMSFHGGVVGVSVAIILMARHNKLDWLRIHDYIACVVPIGLGLGRLANFVNGELWGRPTEAPWGIVFPGAPDQLPRHPSQLYEFALEGVGLFLLLWFLFYKTGARKKPGMLVGTFLLGYGLARFIVEFFREPDIQLGTLSWGLTMGQTLCLPMIAGGLYLVGSANARARGNRPGGMPA
jgi:phosphatidylglycerol:prolipoprotein diacylglycerol transferase